MYNPQLTVDRIREMREAKGISVAQLNEACGLNRNTIAVSANSKTGLSAKILTNVSEILGCSVDYLLGKTDDPAANTSIIKTGDINSSSNIGNNNSISISATAEAENEISSILSGLKPRERTELMMMIYQFADNHSA